MSSTHVGDVGASPDLRYYYAFAGESYGGSTLWLFVFDPTINDFVAGFIPCTLVLGVNC